MKTIHLGKPWSFVSPQRTIDYPAGTFEVTNEIHDAAVAAGVVSEEKADDRDAKAGAARRPAPPEK